MNTLEIELESKCCVLPRSCVLAFPLVLPNSPMPLPGHSQQDSVQCQSWNTISEYFGNGYRSHIAPTQLPLEAAEGLIQYQECDSGVSLQLCDGFVSTLAGRMVQTD